MIEAPFRQRSGPGRLAYLFPRVRQRSTRRSRTSSTISADRHRRDSGDRSNAPELTFAVASLGRSPRGGRLAAGAWVLGIGALIGVAIVAPRSAPAPADAAAVDGLPRNVAAEDRPWQASRPNVVVFDPAGSGVVRAGRITVAGFIDGTASSVTVSIRNRREALLDDQSVPVGADGRSFSATVAVPAPAGTSATRRVWLEVIAYSSDGMPVAGMVGPLIVGRATAAPAGGGAKLLGNDGGMGILGVELPLATPWPPQYWPVGEMGWQVNPSQL